MKIFLDTNILMDIILEREGVDTSRQVISRHMSDGGTTRVYTSLLSIVNVAYFTRKMFGQGRVPLVVKDLFKRCNILGMSDISLLDAMTHGASPDFEDAIQISCAEANLCDVIVTRNVADYKGYTWLQVVTPEEIV